MKKCALFFIFMLSSLLIFAQEEDDNVIDSTFIYQKEKFYLNEPDSVRIGWYSYSDKEYDNYEYDKNKGDSFDLLGQAFLTKKEVRSLNKYLSSENSFCGSVALLNHVDIELLYYKNGQVMQKILFSSFTRNIVVFDKQENLLFRNSINKKFHRFVAGLMKNHKLWSSELQFNFYENYDGDCN